MIHQNLSLDFLNNFTIEQLISGFLCIILAIVFLVELRKYLKYHSYPDLMELSGVGVMVTSLFAFTGDFLLSGLSGILALMVIGIFEVRENAIWIRMMGTFTISYGFFFIMVLLGFITTKTIPSLGNSIKNFLISLGISETVDIQQFFVGIGYNLIIWILILTAFIVFGRKFIIVTRFISPQMVYLALYLVALLIITRLDLPELTKYLAIFIVNVLIYLSSGPLLTFLLGIKPLKDERVEKIISDVQKKINTPIRKIGIVNAPILNAFAYGPWFDQRIAYIATDLNIFTDSEILGITAHELAHVQKKHTLWLLFITAIELIIKAIIDAPSTYWEYVLGTSQTWDFLSFWLFNMVLFSFLLTIVKILEGQADKITKETGFGIQLAESLYRLEGFYYGIAGEIGFNVQLMTGKIRSKDENTRFMGDEAFYLYRNLAPSRMSCIMNLIASHPMTSIRIAMQVDPTMGALEAGFMIWSLLIPGLRGRALKRLQKNHREFEDLLSKKFNRDFGSVEEYLEITFEESVIKHYLNRFVLAKPWLSQGITFWGKIISYEITNNIVSPIEFELELRDGNHIKISKGDYKIIHAEPHHNYISKKGDILTLDQVELKDGKFKKFHFVNISNGKRYFSRSIGLDQKELMNQDYWLVYKNGMIQPWKLHDVQFNGSFKDSIFNFKDTKQEEIKYTGNEILISTPPIIHMMNSKNWDKQYSFLNLLKDLEEPLILYNKEDIDIGIPIKIKNVADKLNTLEILEGRTKREIGLRDIDALILNYPYFMINLKKEMGFGNILSLKMFNRDIKTQYIGI